LRFHLQRVSAITPRRRAASATVNVSVTKSSTAWRRKSSVEAVGVGVGTGMSESSGVNLPHQSHRQQLLGKFNPHGDGPGGRVGRPEPAGVERGRDGAGVGAFAEVLDTAAGYASFVRVVLAYRVGNRPDRIEPRARKRRPKAYPPLSVPRADARKRLTGTG
jgi:hypothetical protein